MKELRLNGDVGLERDGDPCELPLRDVDRECVRRWGENDTCLAFSEIRERPEEDSTPVRLVVSNNKARSTAC